MNDTELIKDKIDIADLVGEYVQLKPAGMNKKGLCPFHHEKTPSFMVNSERQRWHCFGCAKGGDIFSFIEEIEGLEFIEALKFLASRAGVQLTNTREDVNKSQKNRSKDINVEAARFFHNVLIKLPGAWRAREYLAGRGVKPETIEAWQIGFIPGQWDLLTQYLFKKGYSIDDLVAAGLTIKRDNSVDQTNLPISAAGRGFYDRFRGRIMFPIWDIHGTVVGFTGRVLVETEHSGGKYVNTPQTLVYDKSRVVFGLNFAKQEIKKKNLTVLVEGQMDVVACHQAGMTNVVATSGTALTEAQVALLKRYSNNLAIAFDADTAGVAAAKRGIDVALTLGMNIRVIRIPEGAGKDPDECLKKNSAVWLSAVDNAQDIMEWYFTKAFAGKDIHTPKDKQKIVNELIPEIQRIPYAVERDHWLRELASKLAVDVSVLREDIDRFKLQAKLQPHGVGTNEKPLVSPADNRRLDRLVDRLFVIWLRGVDISAFFVSFDLEPLLSTPAHRALYESLKKNYNRETSSNDELGKAIFFVLGENIADTYKMQGDLLFSETSMEDLAREAGIVLEEIKKEWRRERLSIIQQQIDVAEKEKNQERLKALYIEFELLR